MFNYLKHSQQENDISGAPQGLFDAMQGVEKTLKQDETVEQNQEDIVENLESDQATAAKQLAAYQSWQKMMLSLGDYPNDVRGAVESSPEYKLWASQIKQVNPAILIEQAEDEDALGPGMMMEQAYDIRDLEQKIMNKARTIAKRLQQRQDEMAVQDMMVGAGFNLKQTKTAQLPQGSFPVSNAGDLAAKFMERLVTHDYEEYRQATNEFLSAVAGEIQEEEINSALEALWNLNPEKDQARANAIFGKIWDLLPAHLKSEEPSMMEPTMSSENPKGIIKFNLSDHVLNNQKTMVKTAADQFGQQYLLYGPTEKRVCPKLRGKGGGYSGAGDVVSEYICRHHCLDGIVIDDNKTVCGEALWRANAMDKFSREYVNEDGEIEGGYLNKRFEINRNVPEENQMRLKPGETRKPRPPAWGSLESRMQDMRNKEADDRGYRPDSNTGAPFNWCRDVDQNNVEVDQKERDRRETASGHQTVQYTNKTEQENNPKTASFNLKSNKTTESKEASKVENDDVKTVKVETFPENTGCTTCTESGEMPSKSSFNLKTVKESHLDKTALDWQTIKYKGLSFLNSVINTLLPMRNKKSLLVLIDEVKSISDQLGMSNGEDVETLISRTHAVLDELTDPKYTNDLNATSLELSAIKLNMTLGILQHYGPENNDNTLASSKYQDKKKS